MFVLSQSVWYGHSVQSWYVTYVMYFSVDWFDLFSASPLVSTLLVHNVNGFDIGK